MAIAVTARRIRAGLYEATVNGRTYHVEDCQAEVGWIWRVSDTENFFDPWVGDYDTKRDALAALGEIQPPC